jgi:hypothetical protein
MPRSLQQRIKALDLHPSTAEGSCSREKNWFSPWACATKLEREAPVSRDDFMRMSLTVPGDGTKIDLPSADNESVLAGDDVVADNRLASGDHTPSHGPKRSIQPPTILDFRQVDDPIRLYLDLGDLKGRHQKLILRR